MVYYLQTTMNIFYQGFQLAIDKNDTENQLLQEKRQSQIDKSGLNELAAPLCIPIQNQSSQNKSLSTFSCDRKLPFCIYHID